MVRGSDSPLTGRPYVDRDAVLDWSGEEHGYSLGPPASDIPAFTP